MWDLPPCVWAWDSVGILEVETCVVGVLAVELVAPWGVGANVASECGILLCRWRISGLPRALVAGWVELLLRL